MKETILLIFGVVMFIYSPSLYADVWTDNFDGNELVEEWSFRDRPGDPSTAEVKDGVLRLTNPNGNWGHMEKEKPMLERDVPKTAKDVVVSGLFSSEPDKPADAWIGIFIFGSNPMDFACLLFGGEANQAQKCLIGSMVQNTWQDKGHFPTGVDVPLYLKLEKIEDKFAGYYRADEKEDWTMIGTTWPHAMKAVKTVGVGFINSWGGKTVTIIVDFFSLEGEGVRPFAIDARGKLSTTWGSLKKCLR